MTVVKDQTIRLKYNVKNAMKGVYRVYIGYANQAILVAILLLHFRCTKIKSRD